MTIVKFGSFILRQRFVTWKFLLQSRWSYLRYLLSLACAQKRKKNIADIDIIGNFRVTHLASNQSIQIGQSAVFGFVHFPVERNNGN